MRKKKYPKVLLVGRTNVGKSTLFNRITSSHKSIVSAEENITRDHLHEIITWNDISFDVIDTGGLMMTKTDDGILQSVRNSVVTMLENAHLILFLCDVKDGLMKHDRIIARHLHKTKKPVLLVLNKADCSSAYQNNHVDFYALGFKTILPISANHGIGISTLLDTVSAHITTGPYQEEKVRYNVAIIGKPNVGKSSLLNSLLNKERSIVSETAGTTREAISETLHFYQEAIQITDTAGIRRKKNVVHTVEKLMVKNSLAAIRQADSVLLILDASEGIISDQELKLLSYAFEQKKGVIVLFNKMDLVSNEQKARLKHRIAEYDFLFKKLSILWISCKTAKNIGNVIIEIDELRTRQVQTFNTIQLNDLIIERFSSKPLFHKTHRLKLFKIRPIKRSIPTFVLYVNQPEWFGQSYLGFIENILRKEYPLKGCPVHFIVKKI